MKAWNLIGNQWKSLRPFWRRTIIICIGLAALTLFFWNLSLLIGSRRVIIWSAVVIWFLHVFLGAGAGFAAWRLWPDRDNPFIRRLIVSLHGLMLSALWAIVLLFLSRGVRFTWKFSIAFFGGTALIDGIWLPLVLYIIRGPQRGDKAETASRSGELPPDYWRKEFREAVRSEVKDEYLKPKPDGE